VLLDSSQDLSWLALAACRHLQCVARAWKLDTQNRTLDS
jgi:hypothetical protein